MSPSLRDFMFVSVVGMTLLLSALLYFHLDLSQGYMKEHLSIHSNNLAIVVRNSLLASGLGEEMQGDSQNIPDDIRTRFDATLKEELRWVPVVKVKVYGRNRRVLYSTEPSEVGLSASRNKGVASALSGTPVSDLVQRYQVNRLDGAVAQVDLHQQYIPIKHHTNDEIDGVFEIYTDVSGILANVDAKQRMVFWSIAGILGAFYLALAVSFLRTHRLLRAEQKQREQHLGELQEISSELEIRVEERTAELDKSKKFLQSVIDGIGNPLVVIRPDYTIALMNNAARRLIPPDKPLENYRHCYQISHRRDEPCDGPDHPCSFAQVMKYGRASRVRHTHYDANNQPLIVDLLCTPLYSEDGSFEGVIEVQHDVTQMVRMQAGLVESEARLQAIMDHVPDAILTCDSECVIQSMNPSALNLFNGTGAELIGEKLTKFFAAGETEDALKPHNATQKEALLQRLDGSEFPADIWIGPLEIVGDTSYIAVVRDITGRLRAQQELETTRQQYFHNEKMAAIGQLAAGILHEVGNPIAAIAGAAAELKNANACRDKAPSDCPYDGIVSTNISLIDEQTTRLGRITREIADFASPRPRERELLDLNSLLQSTARLLTYDRRFRGIELHLDLDPNLPAIVGVADQLTQVFMNLMINAVDACMAVGEGGNCILLKSEVDGEWVRVTVQDKGCGMSEESIAHALEPFYTTKPVGKGTGLGLSLCDSIALAHGGSLDIESEEGKGTSVKVGLPIEPPDARSDVSEQGAYN
jgi:PAS domain S-box-containing protein